VIWATESLLEENTHYYWTAAANDGFTSGDWMPTQTFFYNRNNDKPTSPSPALPLNDGTVANSQVALTVDAADDGDQDALTYGFILTDINGEFVRSMEGIMETYPTVRWEPEVALTDQETYCWTSFAVDEHGSQSEPSVEACFTVDQDNMVPTLPVIKQPTPGEMFATDTIVMQVSNCADPEGRSTMYRLELDTEPNFSSENFEGENRTALVGSDMNLILDGLEDDTTYYARVLCSDGAASSDWVQTNFFVDLDNEAPSVPKLHNPPADTAMSAGDELGVVNAIDPEDDNVRYDFAIYNVNEELVAQAFDVKESETGYSRWQPPALDGGQYTWTARSVDEMGMESGWSERRAVVVANESASDEFELEVSKGQVVAQPDATIGAPSATTGCSYLERRGGLGWLVLTIGGLVLGGRRRR
jgi:hypothetical protein